MSILSLFNTFVNYGKDIISIIQGVNLMKMFELDTMIISFDIGRKMITKNTNKNDLIQRYKNIYKLDWLWRIIIYTCSYYSSYYTMQLIRVDYKLNILLVLLVIPNIQNLIVIKLLEIDCIKYYLDKYKKWMDNKISICMDELNMYMKYLLAKYIIINLRKITEIRNSDIFVLMAILNFNLCKEFLQNFIFVGVLLTLREYDSMYYYYKGIKLSYYYQTNYLINKMDINQAQNDLKNLLENKKWYNIGKIEFITPLINIIYQTNDYKNIFTYEIIKFLVVWSWINWVLNRRILEILFLMIIITNTSTSLIKFTVFFITCFTNYVNNSLYYLISVFIYNIIVMRYILYDTCFYIQNYRSIKIIFKLEEKKINK